MATNRERFAVARENGQKAVDDGNLEDAQKFRIEAENLKGLIETEDALKSLEIPETDPIRPPMPGAGDGSMPQATPPEPDTEQELLKAVSILRFGKALDSPQDLVMHEIYGGDYRQIVNDADRAFAHYIRTGKETKGLGRQVWGIDDVTDMLKDGLSVAAIKATMVEGQDVLGGYAVPPQYGSQIIQRLPGLTAVRAGGATVVQTVSNSIEWLKLTGGNSQYITSMRGLWGAETQSPTGDDFGVGTETLNAHVYTYKVAFSASLLEDATNLSTIFTNLVSETMAIDEDAVFLIGDGAGKPRGILPSSANAHSLSEVNSGNANTLLWSGLRSLRRGLQSQYRARATWIMESDSAGDIEVLVDGMSRPYFEYLESGDRFMRHPLRESESMPAVSADTFPIIFGDLSGYWIVERIGLAVQRYNDSNTGINVVEFHVRRRIGGDVVEPWKFAVQKVSA